MESASKTDRDRIEDCGVEGTRWPERLTSDSLKYRFDRVREKLFHLHAKDVRFRHERIDDVGIFDYPLEWHQPRIPGFGDIDWARFVAALLDVGYDGPVCIEVEDDTFGKTLAGRKRALRVARNVLAPFVGETA